MQEIHEQLKSVIKGLYGLDTEVDITPSPDNIDADYSSNIALKLTKVLHKPPMEIASEILNEMMNPKRVTAVEGDPQNVFRRKNFGGGKRLAGPARHNKFIKERYVFYDVA